MGLFDRVSRVIRSNLNAMVGAAEDPEKVLEQAIEDMQEDFKKMKQAVVQAIASREQVQKQLNQAEEEAGKWHKRAQRALKEENEELARAALGRKKMHMETATSLQTQLNSQRTQIDTLKQSLVALEDKISEAKTKKDMLKARASAAKANERLQNTVGQLNTSSSVEAFERMEERVSMMEAKSKAAAELAGTDLESQFAALESGDIDDELAAMKAEMLSGASVDQGQLPEAKEDTERPQNSASQDSEIDAELEELRAQIDQL